MTDTPAIRTHQSKVDDMGHDVPYPAVSLLHASGFQYGERVLVVAGLPEGCELRRICDVPEGWEWQGPSGNWYGPDLVRDPVNTGLVPCRPAQPATPATEQVVWHQAIDRTLASNGKRVVLARKSAGYAATVEDVDDECHLADRNNLVEVLVEAPAPQPETDEPLYPCPHGIPGRDCDCEIPAPVPAGRWTIDDEGNPRCGAITFVSSPSPGAAIRCTGDADSDVVVLHAAVYDALVKLVRGSQVTRPTADLATIRAAIFDPGRYTPREKDGKYEDMFEDLYVWQARAVVLALDAIDQENPDHV